MQQLPSLLQVNNCQSDCFQNFTFRLLSTARHRSCGKVIFSVVSVCQPFCTRVCGEAELYRALTPPPRHVQSWPYSTGTSPPPDTFKFVNYKARTSAKRTVGILLNTFLLLTTFTSMSTNHVEEFTIRIHSKHYIWGCFKAGYSYWVQNSFHIVSKTSYQKLCISLVQDPSCIIWMHSGTYTAKV